VAAAALVGPIPAALIAVAALGVVDLARGEQVLKLTFNAVVYGIAGLWSSLAFAAAGGTYGRVDQESLPALLALVAVHALVPTVLIGAVVGSTQGRSPLHGILLDARALQDKLMEYSLGLLLALLASMAPAFVPFLVPLLLAVYRQHARSAALGRETQTALRHLADIVDERDPYTYEHSERVGDHVERLALALRLPERRVRSLTRAGRLHDLGKIVVDAAVLRKPGRLNDEEFEQLRAHPAVSARLLAPFGFAGEEARIVELHHERYDGRGYYHVPPDELPLEAHFLILADAYDAMTSDRPYRKGLSHQQAADEIRRNLGTQFHPQLGLAFIAAMEGREPSEELDAAQLRALRAVLARRRGSLREHDVRAVLRAARPAAVRLLAAGSVVVGGVALLYGPALWPVAAFAALTGGIAAWRARGGRAAVDRALAGLDAVGPEWDTVRAVTALDEEFPLLWAGSCHADEHGRLHRTDAWVSAAAPTSAAARIDGALRRTGASLRRGRAAILPVGGRRLVLVPQGDGWLGLLPAAGTLPDAIIEEIAARARPRTPRLHVVGGSEAAA
jgi:HD-GYP domain-containing protein (c-di-GMP phosphodiesterase class II)